MADTQTFYLPLYDGRVVKKELHLEPHDRIILKDDRGMMFLKNIDVFSTEREALIHLAEHFRHEIANAEAMLWELRKEQDKVLDRLEEIDNGN